jgi:hypothetical protein
MRGVDACGVDACDAWGQVLTLASSHKSANSALQATIYSDMVTRMKTTIDIANPLLEAAKKAAAREGTTLRALVELGLRQVLETRRRGGAFRLRKASFRGQGLQPAAKDLSWEQMRELAYGERGR